MPAIDFDRLRAEIRIEQVLHLLGFEPTGRKGPQWHGHCPLPECTAERSRSFSVHVLRGRYYCHRCHSRGNSLELWATSIEQPLYPAAIDLCGRLGREVPWIRRWRTAAPAMPLEDNVKRTPTKRPGRRRGHR